MAMTKKQAKEKAKEVMTEAIGYAYYRLENENLSEEDNALVVQYMNEIGKRACKAIGTEYVAY